MGSSGEITTRPKSMNTSALFNRLNPVWQRIETISHLREKPLVRYALTLVTTLVFAGIQASLWGVLDPHHYFFFYPAIVFSVFLWGLSAGVFSSLASTAIVIALFTENPSEINFVPPLLFTINGVVISLFSSFLFDGHRFVASRRLNETLARMGDGFFFVGPDLRYQYVNPRALEMTGKKREEIVGKTYLQIWPELADSGLDRKIRQSLQESGLPTRLEFESPSKRWFEIAIYPTPPGSSIYFREITERKTVEERLKRTARETTEANEKLKRTVHELERSNQELAQFAHAASHDMKEPLRMVSNFVQLLEQNYGPQLDAEAKQYIQYASEGAKRMHALITAILDYSELGTQRMESQPCSLSSLLDEAIDSVRTQVEETRATISRGGLPIVTCPSRQIEQVFENLLSNAMKFRSKSTLPEIRVEAVERETDWLVSVRDNGLGVDPSHQEKIFKLFRRFHSRSEFPGSGIGLATCERILDRIGGKIWVKSTLGEGSTFYFTLPKFT